MFNCNMYFVTNYLQSNGIEVNFVRSRYTYGMRETMKERANTNFLKTPIASGNHQQFTF